MIVARPPDPIAMRARLAESHLLLVFTPEICGDRNPLECLGAALESIDVIQIRPKAAGSDAPGSARDTFTWGVRVLDLLSGRPGPQPLVVVNDRIDVARVLQDTGCAGVHLGQDDCPVEVARELLGPAALIGLSTHNVRQVAEAAERSFDYLGFGPIHATRTRGYDRGLGCEAAWIAAAGSSTPLFPIGGIDVANAGELSRIGRAAVGSAILSAADPGCAAREIRRLLASV